MARKNRRRSDNVPPKKKFTEYTPEEKARSFDTQFTVSRWNAAGAEARGEAPYENDSLLKRITRRKDKS